MVDTFIKLSIGEEHAQLEGSAVATLYAVAGDQGGEIDRRASVRTARYHVGWVSDWPAELGWQPDSLMNLDLKSSSVDVQSSVNVTLPVCCPP